jgi:hypothetical protein
LVFVWSAIRKPLDKLRFWQFIQNGCAGLGIFCRKSENLAIKFLDATLSDSKPADVARRVPQELALGDQFVQVAVPVPFVLGGKRRHQRSPVQFRFQNSSPQCPSQITDNGISPQLHECDMIQVKTANPAPLRFRNTANGHKDV